MSTRCVKVAVHDRAIIIRRMSAEPHWTAASSDRAERRQDAWHWRLFMTGLSFFTFGVGALIVGTVLLPIVKLIPAPQDVKRRRARAVMSAGLRLFVGIMHRGGVLTYEFH